MHNNTVKVRRQGEVNALIIDPAEFQPGDVICDKKGVPLRRNVRAFARRYQIGDRYSH